MTASTNPVSAVENSLFQTVRYLALAIAALCIVALLYLGYLLATGFAPSTNVNYDEINVQAQSDGQTGAPVPPKYTMPKILQPYLGGDNKKILDQWLDGLDERQRSDFLGNMSRLVEEGQKKGADGTDVVNAYKEVKLQKLHAQDADRNIALIKQAATVGMMTSLLMLVLLVTAILVLLAVERHTRPPAALS